MIPRREKVGHAAVPREPIDQRHETDIPLMPVAAVDGGIAGLQNELHRVRRRFELFDAREHRVDDERVLVLDLGTVAASARVTVCDE